MSWLNTIKDITNKVLAETAGPGDDEYNAAPSVFSATTDNEQLQLEQVCLEQSKEIDELKKQIEQLRNQKKEEIAIGLSTVTLDKPQIDRHGPNMDDSWSWELPDAPKTDNAHFGDSEMVSIISPKNQEKPSEVNKVNPLAALLGEANKRIDQLECDKKDLYRALEDLDSEHNISIQNVLEIKTELQEKLVAVTRDRDNLKEEKTNLFVKHEIEMARIQKQLEELEKKYETSEINQKALQVQYESTKEELKERNNEISDMQLLLEKKDEDNKELIERIRSLGEETEKLTEEQAQVLKKLEDRSKQLEDAKKQINEMSSSGSSSGKLSEEDFIVVRDGDAHSSEPNTPPAKQELQDKIVQLENRVSELTLENGSLTLKLGGDEEKHRQLDEDLKDTQIKYKNAKTEISELKIELERLRLINDSYNELQKKYQQMTLEIQANELKEISLPQENDSLPVELEVTDLDEEEEENIKLPEFSIEDVMKMLKKEGDKSVEQVHALVQERLSKYAELEKKNSQLTAELRDLQNCKQTWKHEKKTLEADISQYILQCDELMKNNEILLNELENYKCNKLQTIPEEHVEENIFHLESQLEECTRLNKSFEMEYVELNDKINEIEREKQILTEKLRKAQQECTTLKQEQKCPVDDAASQLEENELRKRCADLSEELKDVKMRYEEAQQLLALNQRELKSIGERDKKIELLQVKNEKIMKELSEKEGEIKLLHENAEAQRQRFAELEQLETQLANEKVSLKDDLKKSFETKFDELNDRINELESEKQILKEKLREAKHESDTLKQEQKIRMDDTASKFEVNELRKKIADLSEELVNMTTRYEEANHFLTLSKQEMKNALEDLKFMRNNMEKSDKKLGELQAKHDKMMKELSEKEDEIKLLQENAESQRQRFAELEQFKVSENDGLIKALEQKHAESMQYYAEIQRLQLAVQQLQQQVQFERSAIRNCENCEKLETNIIALKREQEKIQDQVVFLKEKSDILTTNLLTEQTNQRLVQEDNKSLQDQNTALQKELTRLREHLLEVEEQQTEEAVEMQRTLDEYRERIALLETEVSKSSTAYTSASIRANQQAETLQAQYTLLLQQRDELLAKLSLAENREAQNQAAIFNLQNALEQFQNDKENDIKSATQRVRKELQMEELKQKKLQDEIEQLGKQLFDANQGLKAAARLSDQLEECQKTILSLREELEIMQTQNEALEHKLANSEGNQTERIDKSLIKSLIIGYFASSNDNDKQQILRMITSVLEFTQLETEKVGLNRQRMTWLGSILGQSHIDTNTQNSYSKENLVEAFVHFLEKESQPFAENMPNLLNVTQTSNDAQAPRRPSVSDTSPVPIPIQPLLMSSNEFTPSRNSSSILKDILNDT